MKFSIALTGVLAATTKAAYPGDIVQYWTDQTSLLVNGTVINGLQNPPISWGPAIVFASIYVAATDSASKTLAFQQLAVSHAAHNSLIWFFHGTRNYAPTDAALRSVLGPIGIAAESADGKEARSIGRAAARRVVTKRSDDGNNDFVDYVMQPPAPGVYQNTSGGAPLPDTPQSRYVELFGGVGPVTQFQYNEPPKPSAPEYEKYVDRVKSIGELNSTVRTAEQTQIAYYWRQSSVALWTSIANAVIGSSLKDDVPKSAKFYAQFYYSLANAAIAAWHVKYTFNTWRPETAIRYPGVYLASGKSVTQSNWTPLLTPTPSHQDYIATHAAFGAAAAQAIRSWIGTDSIQVTVSSNVTVDNVGVLTRSFTNLTYANWENGESRVLGGIHFTFASEEGTRLGTEVALATIKKFDRSWAEF